MKLRERSELQVHQIVSTVHGQNCYIILDGLQSGALVVDPGYGTLKAATVLLKASGRSLDYILLTHEHYDHIGNVDEFKRSFPCQVVASQVCSDAIPDPKRNFSLYHEGMAYAAMPADLVFNTDEMILPWGSREIRLHLTPGHSLGSICIELADQLFTGDTLIKEERTVVKLPGGSRESLSATLDWMFSKFPEETRVRPGHGDTFLLGETTKTVHCRSSAR